MSASPSPPPPDLSTKDAQSRLAKLEQLLAGQFFPSTFDTPDVHSSVDLDRPSKRRNSDHDPPDPPLEAQAEQVDPPKVDQAVAFRLFSTQTAPQTVIIREGDGPHPVVLDRRIRAVEDEPAELRHARQTAIRELTVEGKDVLAAARLPPSNLALQSHLHTTRTARLATPVPPPLAYLNALLPRSLSVLSPYTTPSNHPPERPHDGLLSQPPFKLGVKGGGGKPPPLADAIKVQAAAPMSKSAKKRAAKRAAAGESVEGASNDDDKGTGVAAQPAKDWSSLEPLPQDKTLKRKDPRIKMPPRNSVLQHEARTGMKLRLRVVDVSKGVRVGKREGMRTKQGGRISRARRERVRKRERVTVEMPAV
ncbi:hypothetical protein JCM11641_000498 [Rhodosporidiobolus odoratus]